MRIFIDANVIISVLNREYPLFASSARILSLADNPKYKVYTSPICLAIAFYFSEKKNGTTRAKEKVAILSRKLKITHTDHETVRKAIENPAILDFEDGMEYYSALDSNCQVIITEDISDFYFSSIRVLSCESFINTL